MALTVVQGPPAAGKSAWVTSRAQAGDIVIDLDRIAQALTVPGASSHTYGRTLRTIAQRARQAAISEALRYCTRVDVYLIHTHPSPEQLAQYVSQGGQVVTVDPGRDVVMARIAEQRSVSARTAADRWYATHGDTITQQAVASRTW